MRGVTDNIISNMYILGWAFIFSVQSWVDPWSSLLQNDEETTWAVSGKIIGRSVEGKLSWSLKTIYFLTVSPANDGGKRKAVLNKHNSTQSKEKQPSSFPRPPSTVENKMSERGAKSKRSVWKDITGDTSGSVCHRSRLSLWDQHSGWGRSHQWHPLWLRGGHLWALWASDHSCPAISLPEITSCVHLLRWP